MKNHIETICGYIFQLSQTTKSYIYNNHETNNYYITTTEYIHLLRNPRKGLNGPYILIEEKCPNPKPQQMFTIFKILLIRPGNNSKPTGNQINLPKTY